MVEVYLTLSLFVESFY